MDRKSVISFCTLELTFFLSKVLKVISSCKNRRCDYLYATEFCSLFVENFWWRLNIKLNINHQLNIYLKYGLEKLNWKNWFPYLERSISTSDFYFGNWHLTITWHYLKHKHSVWSLTKSLGSKQKENLDWIIFSVFITSMPQI